MSLSFSVYCDVARMSRLLLSISLQNVFYGHCVLEMVATYASRKTFWMFIVTKLEHHRSTRSD